MTRKQKKALLLIIIAAVTLGAAYAADRLVADMPIYIKLAIYLVPYFVVGFDILRKSVKNIAHGNVFDENFLMSLATIGAFAVGEYPEAVFVMLFYQIGELFSSIAVGKSRRSISALMNIRPDAACVLRDGEEVVVSPDEVEVGEITVVRPGEKIPIDGVVVDGESEIDTSSLTGESVPKSVGVGDEVLGGCINASALIKVRTTKPFGMSSVAKILELVENASSKKAKTEKFITRFAKIYTPVVVALAVMLAVIPSLLTSDWAEWTHRALSFLVVSCPCALVISVPLAYFAGIGGASSNGILIKGSDYIEALSEVGTVVFDKTGTLTKGKFRVDTVVPHGTDEATLLSLAASAEKYSTHPIAVSICEACENAPAPSEVREISGEGVEAVVEGRTVRVGNMKLMKRFGVSCDDAGDGTTAVFVAAGEEYLGYITVSDEIKPDAAEAIGALKQMGVESVMLSGDRKNAVERVAYKIGVGKAHYGLLPEEKVAMTEKLIGESDKKVAFVGDGINDAPVLMCADVGIAMGALGSDAAINAADVVIIDDKPSKVASAIKMSKKTRTIVKENIVFSLVVKVGVLVLGALGIASMGIAVFADVGVAVIATLNSMRALKTKKSLARS